MLKEKSLTCTKIPKFKNAKEAFYYAVDNDIKLDKHGENLIGQEYQYSYWYARDIIKGRWGKGENAIGQDAGYSYYYARDIMKSRFELGENIISQDAGCSYRYARSIVKGRWKKGENAISQNEEYSCRYAKDVIKGKLPENMHNKMICFGITDPNNNYVKDYFEFINENP